MNASACICRFVLWLKAYPVDALKKLRITRKIGGMPLQLWIQAVRLRLHQKVGGRRIYLDPKRAFGGVLNDANERAYYRRVVIRRPGLPEEPRCLDPGYRGSALSVRLRGDLRLNQPGRIRAPRTASSNPRSFGAGSSVISNRSVFAQTKPTILGRTWQDLRTTLPNSRSSCTCIP